MLSPEDIKAAQQANRMLASMRPPQPGPREVIFGYFDAPAWRAPGVAAAETLLLTLQGSPHLLDSFLEAAPLGRLQGLLRPGPGATLRVRHLAVVLLAGLLHGGGALVPSGAASWADGLGASVGAAGGGGWAAVRHSARPSSAGGAGAAVGGAQLTLQGVGHRRGRLMAAVGGAGADPGTSPRRAPTTAAALNSNVFEFEPARSDAWGGAAATAGSGVGAAGDVTVHTLLPLLADLVALEPYEMQARWVRGSNPRPSTSRCNLKV